MTSRRSSFKRREKTPFERFKEHFRKFTAFMFSNVGIILLVVFYIIAGTFIFGTIEIKLEESKPVLLPFPNISKNSSLAILNMTKTDYNFNNSTDYKRRVRKLLVEFQQATIKKHLRGPDTKDKWGFTGGFLYSLTVITTIGYGNITPKTDLGKLVTILYAIIGMPLFLLYLSNIGDVLAKSFKWIYSKVCLCRICPGVARRRIIRERRKLRQMAMNKALRDMEDARHSKYSSSTSDTSNTSSYSEETSSSKSSTQSTKSLDDRFEEDDDTDIEREIRGSTDEITVPLTVCIVIMISYILLGALLFQGWENWKLMDGSYFCFISLSSIGFGDLVPGNSVGITNDSKVDVSFILCSVYLLVGMALIAMCFNLMQEQVIHKMRAFKRGFKACFRCKS